MRTVFMVAALGLSFGLRTAEARGSADAASEPLANWKQEFEDVCSKTQDAMGLPVGELRTLIERCDRLAPVLQRLDEPERKVYSRRLRACREMYAYVLSAREGTP